MEDGGYASKISVGIKKLLYISEMAAQDREKVDKFVTTLSQEGISFRG
jgi:hypothetical protein